MAARRWRLRRTRGFSGPGTFRRIEPGGLLGPRCAQMALPGDGVRLPALSRSAHRAPNFLPGCRLPLNPEPGPHGSIRILRGVDRAFAPFPRAEALALAAISWPRRLPRGDCARSPPRSAPRAENPITAGA